MTTQPSAVIATLALPGQFLIAEEPSLSVFVEGSGLPPHHQKIRNPSYGEMAAKTPAALIY